MRLISRKKPMPVAAVVIIGAARSGTKMLRDLLGSQPSFAAVPFDINYVWRYGNERADSDVLEPEQCSARCAEHIRGYLARYANGGATVVEKTVSNALRVAFVERVLPGARYIHLVRDGRDVAASAYDQWRTRPDWRYVLRKARHYPLLDAPGYALAQVVAVARRAGRGPNAGGAIPVWGPRYPGMDNDLTRLSLIEVCARQWVECVERSLDHLARLPARRVLEVRYEEFVTDPERGMSRVLQFLEAADAAAAMPMDRQSAIVATHVGSFRQRLSERDVTLITRHLNATLERLAYVAAAGEQRGVGTHSRASGGSRAAE